jgi:hypothetical protein
MATETKATPAATRRRTNAPKTAGAKRKPATKTATAKPVNGKTEAKPTLADAKARRDRAAKRAAERLKRTDEVLVQLGSTGQSAIDAVRHFVDQLDKVLVADAKEPSGVHEVVDSALELSGVLVGNGTETIRGLVRTTGNTLTDIAN